MDWFQSAEEGDVASLESLVAAHVIKQQDAFAYLYGNPLTEKDDLDEVTPVFLAIMKRNVEAVRVLLDAGSDVNLRCHGHSLLHAAIHLGGFSASKQACTALVPMILAKNPDLTFKDDRGETVLHVASSLGLSEEVSLILDHAAKMSTSPPPVEEGAAPQKVVTVSTLLEAKDRLGQRPLHHACIRNKPDVVQLLLDRGANVSGPSSLGETPLHVALSNHHPSNQVVELLVNAGADMLAANKRAVTPQMMMKSSAASSRDEKVDSKTLIVTHPICLDHHTCVAPIKRDGKEPPPPENVIRLQVLVDKEVGSLRSNFIQSKSEWCEESPRAKLADILRVHEYRYLKQIKQRCEAVEAGKVSLLDDDTAVSPNSFEAAMHAAGGICHAIDQVCRGVNQNAFCAVRPPGHHAGYRGVVEGGEEKHGSAGFCLINNVAVGAAYARNVYRDKGIRKVAIVDFDVHHGNGTEDVVRNLVPSEEAHAINTPVFNGSITTDKYCPWLDEEDANNVFFVSTHGYGRKSMPNAKPLPFFYPGSGASCGCAPVLLEYNQASTAVSQSGVPMFGGSFDASQLVFPEKGQPMVMNVGIDAFTVDEKGQPSANLASRLVWRDAYRRAIFPRLMEFNPDLILISAGFDAHKKDSMASGFVGLIEDDYHWVTRHLTNIANKCCEGRVVSCLEGGYNIQGGFISTFARSVAAHVEALAHTNDKEWDSNDAIWESEHENKLFREQQKRRLMKIENDKRIAAEQMKERLEILAKRERENAEKLPPPVEELPATAELAAEEPSSKRSRRGSKPVDYQALAAQLEQETKMKD